MLRKSNNNLSQKGQFNTIVAFMYNQGMLTLILKGEGALTGLTSWLYRIYWLGISCISASGLFSHFSKKFSLNK